jgi:hypothetical protein
MPGIFCVLQLKILSSVFIERDLGPFAGVCTSIKQPFANALADPSYNLQEREDGHAHGHAPEEQSLIQQLKANPKVLTSSKSIIKVWSGSHHLV